MVWADGVCVCVCVAELGDCESECNGPGSSVDYVSRCRMLPKQTDGQHAAIADIHRTTLT